MGGWGRSWNFIESVGGEWKAVSRDKTGQEDSRKYLLATERRLFCLSVVVGAGQR